MRVALKVLRETRSWIKFIIKYKLVPEPKMAGLLDETEQPCNIFGKSIHTARKKRKRTDSDEPPTQIPTTEKAETLSDDQPPKT